MFENSLHFDCIHKFRTAFNEGSIGLIEPVDGLEYFSWADAWVTAGVRSEDFDRWLYDPSITFDLQTMQEIQSKKQTINNVWSAFTGRGRKKSEQIH